MESATMPFCMFPFCDDENNEIGDNQDENMLDALSYELLSVEDFFVGRGESPQGKAFALATKFAQIRATAADAIQSRES